MLHKRIMLIIIPTVSYREIQLTVCYSRIFHFSVS